MNRILEVIGYGVRWLLLALGLTRRPLPKPPEVPSSTDQESTDDGRHPVRFYGPFIPQWNSIEEREPVLFDLRYQIHGCGKNAATYGMLDLVDEGVLVRVQARNDVSGKAESVYTTDAINATGKWVNRDQFVWVPGWSEFTRPPYLVVKHNTIKCGPAPIQPTPTPSHTGLPYTLTVELKHPNGQGWKWQQKVTVAKSGCR